MATAGFWSRVKDYGGGNSKGSLQDDGNDPENTIVHRTLVDYYMKKQGYPPSWLVKDSIPPPLNNNYAAAPRSAPVSTSATPVPQMRNNSRGGYISPPGDMGGSRPIKPRATLRDIYDRRGSATAAQHQTTSASMPTLQTQSLEVGGSGGGFPSSNRVDEPPLMSPTTPGRASLDGRFNTSNSRLRDKLRGGTRSHGPSSPAFERPPPGNYGR